MRYAEIIEQHTSPGRPFKGVSFSGVTGTMAAALAADGAVCALRYPATAVKRWALQWIHLHYVCIGAFAAPVTAGRRLALKRGSGGDPSGGTALDVVRNDSGLGSTNETAPTGQIATTGALTMTGVTLESAVRARLLIAHAGASGNDYDELWSFDDPLILRPGQLAAIVAGATFDAAGTWQLAVKGGGVELP